MLIQADLVDEFRLFVYPVVQGRGKPLFPEAYERQWLKLLDSKSFTSGITFSSYSAR